MTRRAIKGVLHNVLRTYTSRYSDYDGYWLFGLVAAKLGDARVDLCAEPAADTVLTPVAAVTAFGRRKFREQMDKAGVSHRYIGEAELRVTRSDASTRGLVNGRWSDGHDFTFTVRAVSDRGTTFQDKVTVFVAPHDATLESRSTRGT